MLLVAEMQNGGVFEALTKKDLVEQIIEYFAENEDCAENIKTIYIFKKNDAVDEFSKDFVSKIQDIIDRGVAAWRKTADEEYRGRKQIESEIRGIIYS